jgi:hypothetical protein
VLITSYAIVADNNDQLRENVVLAGVLLALYGIAIFVGSIALLKSKEILGPPAKATGILGIIIGSSFFTILLVFIGIVLLIPYEILSIILLLRIAKRIETQKTSAS